MSQRENEEDQGKMQDKYHYRVRDRFFQWLYDGYRRRKILFAYGNFSKWFRESKCKLTGGHVWREFIRHGKPLNRFYCVKCVMNKAGND
mgnify:CR=1 FL=1